MKKKKEGKNCLNALKIHVDLKRLAFDCFLKKMQKVLKLFESYIQLNFIKQSKVVKSLLELVLSQIDLGS